MNLRKKIVSGVCILALLITIVYVIVQIMNYQLIPVGTIKPVYKAEQSLYFCDPGKGDQLIRMSENGEEIILREKVCNYCLEGDMLLYSTGVGLYVCNADGEDKKKVASFYKKDNVLWNNKESCFFYYGSSIFRLDFQKHTVEELYESPANMVIEDARYYPESNRILFYSHNKNQIVFGEFQIKNKFVSKENIRKFPHEFTADTLICEERLFCLWPSGEYTCININGEEISGHIPLFKHGIYHSYFNNDCIMIYNTFRYDAVSYQIIKLQAESMEESDRIKEVSLWGRLKSYKAK